MKLLSEKSLRKKILRRILSPVEVDTWRRQKDEETGIGGQIKRLSWVTYSKNGGKRCTSKDTGRKIRHKKDQRSGIDSQFL